MFRNIHCEHQESLHGSDRQTPSHFFNECHNSLILEQHPNCRKPTNTQTTYMSLKNSPVLDIDCYNQQGNIKLPKYT